MAQPNKQSSKKFPGRIYLNQTLASTKRYLEIAICLSVKCQCQEVLTSFGLQKLITKRSIIALKFPGEHAPRPLYGQLLHASHKISSPLLTLPYSDTLRTGTHAIIARSPPIEQLSLRQTVFTSKILYRYDKPY